MSLCEWVQSGTKSLMHLHRSAKYFLWSLAVVLAVLGVASIAFLSRCLRRWSTGCRPACWKRYNSTISATCNWRTCAFLWYRSSGYPLTTSLDGAKLTFSSLKSDVPGVAANVKGSYELRSEQINFTGDVRLQAHVSTRCPVRSACYSSRSILCSPGTAQDRTCPSASQEIAASP
jgi:hypothetical protein